MLIIMTKRILLLSSLLLLSACQQNNEAASIVNKQESDFEFTLPELAAIPAGEFDMGCVSGIDCADREEPVHSVTIPAFLMSKTEITADLWDACVKAQACQQPYDSEGNNRPATYTSWDDVQTFITWINTTTGENYRLPSESEWEYAARAGSVTPYNTGDCISTEQANYEGNAFKAAGCTIEGEYRDQTTPVASFSANAFGLHDMHGNMWEWVEDCWHDNYDGAPADGSAWVAGDCERRVMRGGAWHGDVSYMRSAYRFRFSREGRSGGLGFRLAKSYEN
jgi:formylglycine-generating enzyme required for sulfatase activity